MSSYTDTKYRIK